MIDLNELVTWLTLGQVTIAVLLSTYIIATSRVRLAKVTLHRSERASSRQ